MDFSKDYFESKFKYFYEEAVRAKNNGLWDKAKDNFREAASYQTLLAQRSDGAEKKMYLERAKKITEIADTIEREGVAAQKKPTSTASAAVETTDNKEKLYDFYTPEENGIGFDDVVGLEEAKKSVIKYVINPSLYPDAYSYKFTDSKAILLEGPPGTGKTTFAKAVAKEMRQAFAIVSGSRLVNCYIGETAKNIDALFDEMRRYVKEHKSGITLFFDEFEEIAKSREGDDKASAASVPALLRNMDGVIGNKKFLIIANTNCKSLLDKAILERFSRQIYIPLPDKQSREALFRKKISDIEEQYRQTIDFDRIAEQSNGLSGRDITYICDEVKYQLAGEKAGIEEIIDLNDYFSSLIRDRKHAKGV